MTIALTCPSCDKSLKVKDQLVGKIQERYGIKRDEAQKQADEWATALKEDQKTHS